MISFELLGNTTFLFTERNNNNNDNNNNNNNNKLSTYIVHDP